MSAILEMADAIAALNTIIRRAQDPIPFYDYVGAREVQKVRERIQYTKIDPDGKPWAPWAPYTAYKRDLMGNYAQGIMWDTGKLLESVSFDVDGVFGVDIGSDVWYAPKHQEGEGRIPPRHIFGWEDNTLPQLATAFVNFLERGAP